MKKYKKLIIIIIFISLIVCMIIGIINSMGGLNTFLKGDDILEEPDIEIEKIINTEIKTVDSRNDFYVVKSCVEKFYSELNNAEQSFEVDEFGGYIAETNSDIEIEKVYNMLDEEYILYKGITIENLKQEINAESQIDLNISNMYVIQKDERMSTYFVFGQRIEKLQTEVADFVIMVRIDWENKTFKILLDDYVYEFYSDGLNATTEVSMPDYIDTNNVNTFEYRAILDEEYIVDIFGYVQTNLIYNTAEVYKNLDEEYKRLKFESYEDFNEYAENNLSKSIVMKLDKYEKIETSEETKYLCQDTYGNYYIIQENGIMDYSIILDIYTIDIEQFTEKYETLKNNEKVYYNIQKIIWALNEKDYVYIYNKLDETFRNNNFGSVENFKIYVEENFYSSMEVEYTSYEEIGNVYSYTLEFTNTESGLDKEIVRTFFMKLLEETDFVFSFNI